MRTLAAVLLSLALATPLTACDRSAPDAAFPKNFLFGVATAGFQSDPGCPTLPAAACEDRKSDWYHFVTDPSITGDPAAHVSGEPLQNAPGSFELYPQDFDLVANDLHGSAVRLSLEWSRLFPKSTVGIEDPAALRALADPAALAHYHAVFAALKARRLTPLVTLNHYTLPDWIHDAVACHNTTPARLRDSAACLMDRPCATCAEHPGWLGGDTLVHEIAKYAGFAAREFGDEVDLWATLNEPFAVLLPGFLLPTADRSNPPAWSLAFDEFKAAALAMIQAHARMYDAVKDNDRGDADGDSLPARVGLVFNMTPAAPKDPQNPLDVAGAKNLFYLYNRFFLNAVIKGDVDPQIDGTTVNEPALAGRMDYLGINYYTRVLVEGTATATLPRLSPLTTFNPLTLDVANEHPDGLYDMVMIARDYGLPVYITENGTPNLADPEAAPRYLTRHLAALQRSISDGARVQGYFFWTLVDNYEWNHGLGLRFGLYELVADAKKTRRPRPAAAIFSQVAAAGVLPAALLDKYGAR